MKCTPKILRNSLCVVVSAAMLGAAPTMAHPHLFAGPTRIAIDLPEPEASGVRVIRGPLLLAGGAPVPRFKAAPARERQSKPVVIQIKLRSQPAAKLKTHGFYAERTR